MSPFGRVMRVAAFATVLSTGIAQAALIGASRNIQHGLDFADAGTFAGAVFHGDDRINYTAGAAGDSIPGFTFNFTSPSFNVVLDPGLHLSLANTTITPNSFTTDITSTDGQPGTLAIRFDRLPNIGTSLVRDVVGGLASLRFRNSPNGAIPDGAPMIYYVDMPGDWSAAGSGSGQHTLLNLNADWVIDQDFVFDGAKTIFAAHVDHYVNGLNEIGLDFRLFGAQVVPLPATLWLVAPFGMLLLRRRQG